MLWAVRRWAGLQLGLFVFGPYRARAGPPDNFHHVPARAPVYALQTTKKNPSSTRSTTTHGSSTDQPKSPRARIPDQSATATDDDRQMARRTRSRRDPRGLRRKLATTRPSPNTYETTCAQLIRARRRHARARDLRGRSRSEGAGGADGMGGHSFVAVEPCAFYG